MHRLKSISKWLIHGMLAVVVLEIISLLSVNSIRVAYSAYPWDFITVLSYGFIAPVAWSIVYIGIVGVIGYTWICGGTYRVVSYCAAVIVGFTVLAWLLGIGVFCLWHHIAFFKLFPFYTVFSQIPSGIFHKHLVICLFFSFILIGILVGYVTLQLLSIKQQPLGNAHFASRFEIVQGGFFEERPESLIIGRKDKVPLFANGFEHILVFAPTGSGKTTRIAVPNLLHFPYSCVVNDIKLTLFYTTSQYREKALQNRCYAWILSHSEGKTHRYNPFDGIAKDTVNRMGDLQRMAHILIPDGQSDPIWYQSSRKLFKALALYLLDHSELTATLGNLARLAKHPDFDAWLTEALYDTQDCDPEFYRNGFSYLQNHPKTRASILETFSGYLELFDDPLIDVATSASDFDITKLRQEKITIYVGFNSDDTQRLAPLLTLFWEQVIGAMVHHVPKLNDEPYPVLCLIDEFASLGKLQRLRQALSLLREYRVRCVLMLQYLAQTGERYSKDEAQAFLTIKTKIAFTPDSLQDAEWISKLLGTRTLKVNSGSVSSHERGQQQTHSFQYQAVPLLRTDEIMKLPRNQVLILRAGSAPVKAQALAWYDDRVLRQRNWGAVTLPQHAVVPAPFVHPLPPEGT